MALDDFSRDKRDLIDFYSSEDIQVKAYNGDINDGITLATELKVLVDGKSTTLEFDEPVRKEHFKPAIVAKLAEDGIHREIRAEHYPRPNRGDTPTIKTNTRKFEVLVACGVLAPTTNVMMAARLEGCSENETTPVQGAVNTLKDEGYIQQLTNWKKRHVLAPTKLGWDDIFSYYNFEEFCDVRTAMVIDKVDDWSIKDRSDMEIEAEASTEDVSAE